LRGGGATLGFQNAKKLLIMKFTHTFRKKALQEGRKSQSTISLLKEARRRGKPPQCKNIKQKARTTKKRKKRCDR